MVGRSYIVWKLSLVLLLVLLVSVSGTVYLGNPNLLNLRAGLYAVAAAILTVGLFWFLANRLLARRIGALTDGLAKLSEGDFDFRFEIRKGDEFSSVAESFNELADRLQSSVNELRETRDYFEGIVENSADIIITVNPRGYVYTYNRGAEDALGYDRSELIGRSIGPLFADPADRERAREQMRGAENVLNFETRLVTKSGGVRDVIMTLNRLRDPDGSTVGSFGIGKDVTEANRMREKLLHSERFAAIGEALAGLQHSIKNMLNAMKGGAYMVKLGLKKDDAGLIEEGWGMVEDGIDNLTGMSSHMLGYLREWKPKFESVDIAAMVRKIEEMFRPTAEERGVALEVCVHEDPPAVHCDAKLVHSAVMDILSNALDAVLEKDFEEGEKPEIEVCARPSEEGGSFVLSVRDNGCGMSTEVQERVFKPFFSTKKSIGTGLGLAMTSRTIRQHGGEIEVESEENVGSEFRIIVPVEGPNSEQEESNGQARPGRG